MDLKKLRIVLLALQLGRKLPKKTKKFLGIIIAILATWVVILIGLFVTLIVWIVSSFT